MSLLSASEEKFQRLADWEGQADTESLEKVILHLLTDKDPEVRATAAIVLGRLGLKKELQSLAVEALAKGLKDADGTVRLKALESLGKVRNERAVRAVMQVVTDKTLAERMLAAEPDGGTTPSPKLRGEAWDFQFHAAEMLGRMGNPLAAVVLASWAERVMISEVRVHSLAEKGEMIRAALGPVFRRLDASQVFDLSTAIQPTVAACSWESLPEGGMGWVRSTAENPAHAVFIEEMSRRQDDYMKSLNQRDTLFQTGREGESANRRDTLFDSFGGGESAPAGARPAPSAEEIVKRKAELLNDLSEQDRMMLPRHVSSGAVPAPPPMSPEEAERKRDDYMKTLGPKDSLFMPMSPAAGPATGAPGGTAAPSSLFDDEDSADFVMPFGAEPPATPPPPAAPPPAVLSPEEIEERRRAYEKSLGAGDTLFTPRSAPPARETPAAGANQAGPTAGDFGDDLFGEEPEDSAPVRPAAFAAPPAPAPLPPPAAPAVFADPARPSPVHVPPAAPRPAQIQPVPAAPAPEPMVPPAAVSRPAAPAAPPGPARQPVSTGPAVSPRLAAHVQPPPPPRPALRPPEPAAAPRPEAAPAPAPPKKLGLMGRIAAAIKILLGRN